MAETKKPNGKPDESTDKIEFAQATFAGPAAAAALLAIGEDRPKRALDLAKKLFAKGASERQVYAETNKILAGSPYAGVSRTADGQLRFEITDEAARMRPALGRDGNGFLGNVLEHERLYEAYPEARFLGVEKRGDKGGGYTGDSIRIGDNHFAKSAFAGKAMPKDSARGVALHEVQHYAQEAEGHPAGGSPRDFEGKFPGEENRATRMRLYDSLAGEVDAENTRARASMTAERRRAVHPNDTASHPRSEQIVTYADGSTMEQFGGPFPKGYSVKRDTNGLGQTNYKIMHGRRQVGQAYVRNLPDAAQVGRITINEKHQRKGIATALYAQIEIDLGKPVIPDSTLSPKAAAFWRKHRPEALADHIDTGGGTLVYDPMRVLRRAIPAEPNANRSRLQEQADAIDGLLSKPKPNGREMEMADDIKDFGEKIGGARKDNAKKTGPKPKIEATEKDTRPGWMKRFVAAETIDRATKQGSGQWTLLDTRKKGRYGSSPAATRMTFASQAEAERAIPLIAVSQKHSVREQYGRGPDGKTDTSKTTFEIWRRVSGRKAVKATQTVFESRDAAMRFMAENAETLLGTARGYGEEILVKPTNPERSGPAWRTADVQPEQFRNEFGFRGVEFGHWQGDRQQVMNMAYDAMRDLADITGVAPESLTFKERLALAFGARGNGGKQAARAHYEPDRAAVNLTREGGAGTLAHEWMHALDHYLATLDDPKLGVMTTTADGTKVLPAGKHLDHVLFASNRVASANASGSLNDTVRAAYRDLMQSMLLKPEQVTVEASRYEKQLGAAIERMKGELDVIRRDLATEAPSYVKRNRAPASPEVLAKFDEIAAKLLAGEGVETKRILNQGRNGGVAYSARNTNEHADAISAIMKEVRGRAGWDSQAEQGPMDRLARSMNAVASAQKLLDQAKASPTQVVMAPTEFARNARTLDQARTTPYWQTREEMAARAFTAYIEDKIKAAGRGSDYLSFGSDNKFYAIFEDHKPFPEGAERAVINEKFDRLFEAMKQTEVLKPIQAVAGRLGTATTIEGAMKEAAGSRPVSEIPGLRGTQNPNNLAAIVENRQAEAAPKPAPVQEIRQSGKRFTVYENGEPIKDSKGADKWFGTKEKAEKFIAGRAPSGSPKTAHAQPALAKTGASKPPRQTAAAEPRPAVVGDNGGPSEQAIKTAAKLEDVAKRTIERAEKVIAQPRQMNTARRARMGGNVIDAANQDIADAKTALKIAAALKNGEAGALSTVKSLADIRELRRLAKEAEWATDRKEGRNWKEGGHGIKAEDAKNIGKAVGYVRIEPNEVDRLRAVLAGKKGLSADFKALARYAAAAKARNSFEVSNPEVFKAITNVANTIRKADPASLKVKYQHEIKHLKWQAGKYLEEARDFNRKTKLAGTAPEGRQEALRAFLDVREGKSKPSAATLAERDLIGRKLPGFFPTPESLAKRMADLADIRAGQTVLEPSAGTGRLADVAKALGAKVDTVEMQSSLRDILLKKGHNVVDHDFTSMAAEPKYDRIMMNPPFEKGQDMAHVKRAYEMLKPGGKMVAIMGEGGFFRSDKSATEFRSWLDAVGGYSEKLPEGTFKESNTGVNTRLVVIEKPASPDLKQAELSRQTGEVLMRAADSSREIAAKHGNDLHFQMKAHEQAEHGKLYLDRATEIEAGKAKYMPGPDALKEVEARIAAHNEGVYEHGKPVGWSDEARQASADVRATDKAPATLSAVERAMKASEDRAKQAQQSALVEPPKPKRVMEMVDEPRAKIGAGMTVRTASGRALSNVPKVAMTSDRAASASIKKMDAWLHAEAIAEAKATGNDWNQTLLKGINPKRMTPADRASVNLLLFGHEDGPSQSMVSEPAAKAPVASNKPDPVRAAMDAQNAADAKAKAGDFKRYVTLGDGRKVSLGQYTAAWKLAKALPPNTRVNGSPSAYFNGPNTAGDALNEFREGLMDRINQKDPGFGKGRKWDSTWQRDARKLAETLRMKSEVPKGQAHPVDLRPKLAELGRLEEGTFVPKPGGDRSKANQAARNPNYIPGKGVPQEKYWTVKAGPTPTVADLPKGAFKGGQSAFESLSPGMRREIARTAEKLAAKPPVAPASPYTVKVNGKVYPAQSFEQASKAFRAAIETMGVGASQSPTPEIRDASGKVVGHIAYNGRVFPGPSGSWKSGDVPLYDPAGSKPRTPQVEAMPGTAPLGAKPKPVGMDGLTRDQRAGRAPAPVVAEVPSTGSAMDRFRAAYEATLAEQVKANPSKYSYGADRVPGMAQKMTAALAAGNGDIQSPTVKAVAKALGIKPTVGAIKAALTDTPLPTPLAKAEAKLAAERQKYQVDLAKLGKKGSRVTLQTLDAARAKLGALSGEVERLRGPADAPPVVAESVKHPGTPIPPKPVTAEISPTSTVKMMGIPADGGKPFVMAILDMAGDKKTAAERTWNDTQRLYTQKLSGYELVDKAGNKLIGFQNEATLNSALDAQGKAGKGEAKPRTYDAALKAGHGKLRGATGDVALAATAKTLAEGNPGLNPKLVYEGAKAKGLTDSQLRKMSPVEVGGLMFAEPVAAKTPARVSSESRAKPPKLGKNSGLRFVGTDRTLERGPVNVYITGSGEAVVGDVNAVLDTDGRPLGLRRAPSGIELAAARANKDHRFHASAAKAQPDSLSPNFKPAKPTLPDLKAEAKAAGIKGYSSMTKAALMKALDKSGAVAMIVAPAVAAAVAFDATRAEARAAGDTAATAKGVAAGAVAGGTTAAVVYGIGKAIGAGITAVARVAPAAAGPVGLAVAGGLTAYGAYKAYQEHKATGKGAAAAALSLIGADHALHLGASRPPAGPVRLSPEQQSQFAAAAQRWDAMKNAARATDPAEKAKGWSNAARIAAAKARGAEKLPYGGNAAAGPAKWSGSSTSDITAAMKKAG